MIARLLASAAVALAMGSTAAAAASTGCGPVAASTSTDVQRRMVLASIAMAPIPSGTFLMGVDGADGQQGFPQHRVSVAAFRLGANLVTFDQYDRFARANSLAPAQDEGFGRGLRPVINVSREEMLRFIEWLNADSGRHFRLPSEAEWEYAAHGGVDSIYSWGDRPVSDHANTADNRGRDHFAATSPVGWFLPNAYGLYDMAGNVWEMTADCRHESYVGAPADGSAWTGTACDSYIVRGGYYGSITRGIRPTSRSAAGSSFQSMSLGFRLAEGEPLATGPCPPARRQQRSAG